MTETPGAVKRRTYQFIGIAAVAIVLFSFANGGTIGLDPMFGVIPFWMAVVIAMQIVMIVLYFMIFDTLAAFTLGHRSAEETGNDTLGGQSAEGAGGD